MKTLLILRHAKAASDVPVADHDRPLVNRGERQAAEVGAWLGEQSLTPQRIFSSTAQRARTTAQRAAEACGYEGAIEFTDALYGSVREIGADQMVRVIHRAADEHERVMIVGHNPELERLVAALTGVHEHLSPASVAQVELNVDRWKDLDADGSHLLRRVMHCPI